MKREHKRRKSEAGQHRPAKSRMSARRKPHDWMALLEAIEADARSHPGLNFDEQYVHAIQRALDGRDNRLLLELLDRGAVGAVGSWLIHPCLGPALADVIRSQRDGAVGSGARLTAYQDGLVRQNFDALAKSSHRSHGKLKKWLADVLHVSLPTIERSLHRTRDTSK